MTITATNTGIEITGIEAAISSVTITTIQPDGICDTPVNYRMNDYDGTLASIGAGISVSGFNVFVETSNIESLQRLGGTSKARNSVWVYTSDYSISEMLEDNYFFFAIPSLSVGDCVFLVSRESNSAIISFVKTKTVRTITLASGTNIGDA